MSALQHYTFANSSAAYRTRIALNLKGLKAEERYIHLLRDGGQQHSDAYKRLNPSEAVPTLVTDGHVLGQSLAIIEYLDETYPEPPLLPADPILRARARQIALAVACDIHPLNNLRVRQYLTRELSLDESQIAAWYKHWVTEGFDAIEPLMDETGPYACGAVVSIADVALVPQVANARKFSISIACYPRITRADEAARALPAFAAAAPDKQPDFGK